jgi:hypothetical protein
MTQAATDELPLERWKRAWRIHSTSVHCTECRSAQFVQFSSCDFQHEPTCSRAGIDLRPWQDLAAFMVDERIEWE